MKSKFNGDLNCRLEDIMKIYVIEVMTLGGLYPTTKVSQEAYTGIIEAQNFCKNRSDKPEQINEMVWKSDKFKYTILELNLR